MYQTLVVCFAALWACVVPPIVLCTLLCFHVGVLSCALPVPFWLKTPVLPNALRQWAPQHPAAEFLPACHCVQQQKLRCQVSVFVCHFSWQLRHVAVSTASSVWVATETSRRFHVVVSAGVLAQFAVM